MSRSTSNHGLFITATDTGTGKTVFATCLAKTLFERGIRVHVRKPVESGCNKTSNGQLLPADALALHEASGSIDSLEDVVPFRFEAAVSPSRAASLEGTTITIDALEKACQVNRKQDDFLLVEGAGGFYSPLTSDGLNADLASRLGLPLIIMAPNRLGIISQILLTLEAAKRRNLPVAAIVLNTLPDPEAPAELDNLDELSSLVLDSPLYNVNRLQDMKTVAANVIDLLG